MSINAPVIVNKYQDDEWTRPEIFCSICRKNATVVDISEYVPNRLKFQVCSLCLDQMQVLIHRAILPPNLWVPPDLQTVGLPAEEGKR